MQTKSSQCGPDRFSTNTCIISDLEWTTSGARNVSQPQISATIFFVFLKNDAPAEQNQIEYWTQLEVQQGQKFQ